MTRLSNAFGDTVALRVKTITFPGMSFKVKVPTTKEFEAIQARIKDVPADAISARYAKITAEFAPDTAVDGVVFTGDDVVIDGRSSRELAETLISMEKRIVEYVKLLVPESGDLSDISYDDIELEWPLQVQIEIVEKIVEVIQPGYKEARKN